MSRKFTIRGGAVLAAVTTAVVLVWTVAAQAGGGSQPLVFQSVGPITPIGPTPGCPIVEPFQDLQAMSGDRIGRATFCLKSAEQTANGTVFTGTAAFRLQGGRLTATFTGAFNSIEPFTSGPLALPEDVASPGDIFFASVVDFTVTGGTGEFTGAQGTIKEPGFFVSGVGDPRPKWVNAVFVADIDGG